MAMDNSFKEVVNDRFSRNFGGTSKGVADPYLSGYHFIHFKILPKPLMDMPVLKDTFKNTTTIDKFLAASCQSVTPPGGTLNKAEFPGLGGTKWSVPTNIDYGNTIGMRFVEYSGTPILKIFHNWIRMIREYTHGVSILKEDGNAYTKSNYSATLLYWTTKPNGVDIEYAACYDGVFPMKDPQDLYAGDIATADKLEIDMDFSIDYIWQEQWVYDECKIMALRYKTEGSKYKGALRMAGQNQPSGGISE